MPQSLKIVKHENTTVADVDYTIFSLLIELDKMVQRDVN